MNGDDGYFDNWDNDQPKYEGKHCATMVDGGKWKVEDCDEHYLALCAITGKPSGSMNI